jgi:hypothetical protein
VSLLSAMPLAAETIHEEKSKYRDITVTQVGDRRCLLFNVHRGDRNQTCMLVNDPLRLVFDYTRMSFAGLLLNPDPERILVIGPDVFQDGAKIFPSGQAIHIAEVRRKRWRPLMRNADSVGGHVPRHLPYVRGEAAKTTNASIAVPAASAIIA